MDESTHSKRRSSFATDAYMRIRRSTQDLDIDEGERRKMLKMCYLWPLTVVGVFLPLLVYIQYRRHDELGQHARQTLLISGIYAAWLVGIGFVNGLVGRLSDDPLTVCLVFAAFALVPAMALTAIGVRWYNLAVREEPVEIPWVTRTAERL